MISTNHNLFCIPSNLNLPKSHVTSQEEVLNWFSWNPVILHKGGKQIAGVVLTVVRFWKFVHLNKNLGEWTDLINFFCFSSEFGENGDRKRFVSGFWQSAESLLPEWLWNVFCSWSRPFCSWSRPFCSMYQKPSLISLYWLYQIHVMNTTEHHVIITRYNSASFRHQTFC